MKASDIAPEISCPQCGSKNVHRTERKGILERAFLYPLGFRAYRCEACDKRFRHMPK